MIRLSHLTLAASLLAAAACSSPKTDIPLVTETVSVDDGFYAQERSWRVVDPENLMLIDTDYGRIGVELYPEIAPVHVERIKTLVRRKFYDGLLFHRVIDGFMNQTGDPTGTGTGDSDLPDIAGEFSFRRATDKMPVTIIAARQINPSKPEAGEVGVGFYKTLPIASQPAVRAAAEGDGKVEANGLHCEGVTSMARTNDPNSANSQFFLMRGTAPWLDGAYSIWGNTVIGRDLVQSFKVGTAGQDAGFEPDKMNRVTLAADWPEDTRPVVKVLKTRGADFKRFLETQKNDVGGYPDICDIQVPVRLNK
jgi:peptidylprolyl isomerase